MTLLDGGPDTGIDSGFGADGGTSFAAVPTYLKASNTDQGDAFGTSVAISRDGTTIAIGAPGEDGASTEINGPQNTNTASNSGAVYILRRVGGAWQREAYLKAAVGTDASFGQSVVLDRTGDLLVVGAPAAKPGSMAVGALFVFRRTGTVWALEQRINNPNLSTPSNHRSANFAHALALTADGQVLAVGLSTKDMTWVIPRGGFAQIYRRSATGFVLEQQLTAASGLLNQDIEGSQFGASLALSSNGQWLAIGHPGESNSVVGVDGVRDAGVAGRSGAVFLYEYVGSAWVERTYLKASNTSEGDQFGTAVAFDDAAATLLVGAPAEDSWAVGVGGDQSNNGTQNMGAGYVFKRSANGWSQTAYLKPHPDYSPVSKGVYLGASVTLSGDGLWAALGATGSGTGGGVHTFQLGSAPVPHLYLRPKSTASGQAFGGGVAFDGPGATLLVGAPYERSAETLINGNAMDLSAPGAGAAFVYQR